MGLAIGLLFLALAAHLAFMAFDFARQAVHPWNVNERSLYFSFSATFFLLSMISFAGGVGWLGGFAELDCCKACCLCEDRIGGSG